VLCYIEVNLIEDIEREQNIHSFNINTGKVPGEAVCMCPFHFLLSGKNVSKGGGSKQKLVVNTVLLLIFFFVQLSPK